MLNLSGRTFMDGYDLWAAFNIFIEEGSADFLRFPPKKQSIEHDWMDSHGTDIDLSRIFFQQREGILNCAIIVYSEEDFWIKHDSFIASLIQPGTRRISFKSHGERSYFVYYKECNNYSQVAPLKGDSTNTLVAAKFSLVIVEPEPKIDASLIFITDETGRFLVT